MYGSIKEDSDMQRMAFVSDFDGTLTFKDFYHIVIDKYMGDKGRNLYTEWKKTRKTNVEFLNLIFGSLNLTQDELTREILDIPFDRTAVRLWSGSAAADGISISSVPAHPTISRFC
jgi:2-hydroxy-3-keto-5-methylthiopentenyl-1-phosphate phosphatase